MSHESYYWKHLDDGVLLTLFSFCSLPELIRCEFVCKHWHLLLHSSVANHVLNELWKVHYRLSNPGLDTIPPSFPDYRGKVADITPLCFSQRQNQVATWDLHLGEKRRLTCRSGHSATLLDDDDTLVLYAGASHLFTFTNTCDIISFTTSKLLAVGKIPLNAPSPRWLHTVAVSGGKTVMFGGQSELGIVGDLFLMHRVFSESGVVNIEFTELSHNGSPRGGHGMVADTARGSFLVFGGMATGQICVNDLRRLEIECLETKVPGSSQVQRGVWTTIPAHGSPPSPR